MASPKLEVFFLFNPSTGAPVTGHTGMSFDSYKKTDGSTSTDVTPPSIVEIGGGAYGFVPVFADIAKGIVYCLNTGTSVSPTRVTRYMRPEDWITDSIKTLMDVETGTWIQYKTGANANQMWLVAPDSTVIQKFNTLDASGNPSSDNIFQRVPTS